VQCKVRNPASSIALLHPVKRRHHRFAGAAIHLAGITFYSKTALRPITSVPPATAPPFHDWCSPEPFRIFAGFANRWSAKGVPLLASVWYNPQPSLTALRTDLCRQLDFTDGAVAGKCAAGALKLGSAGAIHKPRAVVCCRPATDGLRKIIRE